MYERQALLIPELMQRAQALVIGCGMLGSWTIHSLARTMHDVTAFDMDTVGRENIGTQAFSFGDETMNKAQALAGHLQGFKYSAETVAFKGDESQFIHHSNWPLVVVSAVDSFAARRMVAEYAQHIGATYFIDTRAAGTVGVVVVAEGPDIEWYLETLEDDADAPSPECGAEGTAFVGLWVASQVTSSIARKFRGLPVPYKVVHDVGLDNRILTEASAPVKEVMHALG